MKTGKQGVFLRTMRTRGSKMAFFPYKSTMSIVRKSAYNVRTIVLACVQRRILGKKTPALTGALLLLIIIIIIMEPEDVAFASMFPVRISSSPTIAISVAFITHRHASL